MNIIFPDSVKKCVNMQTNGDLSLYTDMPEAYYLDDLLKKLKPEYVLDLGCGIGRASVYFFKKYGWNNTTFYLADGNTCDKRYKGIRKNGEEYYNTEAATIAFCEANGLNRYIYINFESPTNHFLNILCDVAYSFLAIGFHWPLHFYLISLFYHVKPGGYLIFGIRSEPKEWIADQIKKIDKTMFKIIDLKLKPRNSRRSVLVLEVL